MNALLIVGALTTACHETTAPPKEPGTYSLESFNNQPLPAVISAGGGDTTTLFSAILFLDGAGNAVVFAHSREVHPSIPPRDAIDTTRYTYRVVGDSIAFDYSPPCPDAALCPMPPFGKTTSSTLTLFFGGSPEARPVYFYRLLASDPH
ncbi:MAG: hypothetical protein ACXU9Z_15555 [Gemmatimonadaceae bacterium]